MDLWHSVLCEEVLSRDTPRHPNVEIKTHKNFFSSCTKDIILRRKTPGFKKEHFFDAKMIIINFLIDFSVICAFPYEMQFFLSSMKYTDMRLVLMK